MQDGVTRDIERQARPDEASEVDLLGYIHLAWRYRWLLLGASIGAAALGFLAATLQPATYVAAAKVALQQPPAALTDGASLPSIKEVAETREFSAKVVSELRLSQPPFGYDPESFLPRFNVDAAPDGKSAVVTVRLSDAAVAANAANRLAELGVLELARLVDLRKHQAGDALDAQLREAQARLASAREALGPGVATRLSGGSERTPVSPQTLDYRVAEAVYFELAKRAEERRLAVLTAPPVATLVDPARRPDAPVPRHGGRSAIVAGIAGLILALVGVALFDTVRESLARRRRAGIE